MEESHDPQSGVDYEQEEPSNEYTEAVENTSRNWSFGDSWFGFFLILVGGIFLLNTFDIVPWSVWTQVWKFWPLILILIGVKMLVGSSFVANILTLLLAGTIVFFIALYVLSGSVTEVRTWTNEHFNWLPQMQTNQVLIETTTFSESIAAEDYPDINTIEFELASGAEQFSIEDSSGNDIFSIDAEYSTVFEEPILEVSEDGTVLSIGVETGESANVPFGLFGEANYAMNFGTIEGVMTDISIDMGSGSGLVAFDQNKLQDVTINMGSGSLRGELFDEATPASVDIDMGSGDLDLSFDADVNLVVTYDIGSGSLRIDESSVSGSGIFRSSNADNDKTVELSVSMGSGSISIQRN